ncbi:MAG: D-aminoacyl-tRNA deacylase [Candidatus Lokiarchaeia archaeon]|nr:D-aminoacyl-tRNA deacylase [Candidatus Lokiarchaeia archaeon]
MIITTSEDKASLNIRHKILDSGLYNFEQVDFDWHNNPVFKLKSDFIKNEIYLGLTKEPLIFLNHLKLEESKLNPDFLIFASRHTSKTARPAFLVHTTGNWSKKADFGGEPQKLSKTSAILHKAGFISLTEQEMPSSLTNFSLDIEVTHHGPTALDKPLIFMELGSSKVEWIIEDAGVIITKAIFNTIKKYDEYKEKNNQKVGLGFGGTHYAPNFHRLIQNKSIAFSFICPKYYIQELNHNLVEQMVHNTLEKIEYFVIDWKGTNSEDKKHLIPLLEEFNIPIKKTKEI